MGDPEQRRSDRVIPFVSEEEVVVVHRDGHPNVVTKMMDLSEVGTLVYVLDGGDLSGSALLSIYHQEKIFEVPAAVIRNNGRLVAFEFVNPPSETLREIQSKLIHMEIEWMRLSRRE